MSALRAAGGGFDLLHAFWVFPQGTLAVAAGSLLRMPCCREHRRGRIGLAADNSLRWDEDPAKPDHDVRDLAHGKCGFGAEYVCRALRDEDSLRHPVDSRLELTRQYSRDRSNVRAARPGAWCMLQD